MKRRHFITQVAAQAAMLSGAGSVWAVGEKRSGENYGVSSSGGKTITKLGKRSLSEIRDIFRQELYENNLPIWKEKVVDWKYGGYIPHIRPYVNDAGDIVMSDKRLYHQGRVLWLYSYFYNHFDHDEYHLRAAKIGYDFLTKYCVDGNYDWYTRVIREGKVLIPFYDIFACIYTILGIGEFYKASGIEEARDLAVKSAYRVAEHLLSPTFQAPAHGPNYKIIETYREPGTRRLGCWMHFLSTLTPLLKYTKDPGLEKIVRMCVRNILERHYQPELGLAYEFLQYDFKPYSKSYLTDDYLRAVDGFHSIESAWMCMDEALRVGCPEMFRDALNFGHSLLEKCWLERDGKQGLVRYYWPDDPDPFARANILDPYVMNEVFVFCLLALEHTREEWIVKWFDKAFSYSYETPLEWPYGETLHHPRGIMFCIEILDRMIERSGRVSNYLEV